MLEFNISDKNGFPNLKAAISPEFKALGTARGILVDANDDFDSRWQAIANQLRQAGVSPLTHVTPAGTMILSEPRVGVWLMPDNSSPGELEDFIQRLMPACDPVWPRAQRFIDDIPTLDRKFATGKHLRAEIHAWLATRAEPRKMGAAIAAGDLNTTDPLANRLADCLRRLFA